ncbi:MAG: hypothetical protein IPL99_25385 [Candidatus Competibacteraceae bacterium]|nr:hypothetical protein [Candidatus Competibacteraceae bacterium]
MSQVVIDNPVINSPVAEPKRHFCFADNGIPMKSRWDGGGAPTSFL